VLTVAIRQKNLARPVLSNSSIRPSRFQYSTIVEMLLDIFCTVLVPVSFGTKATDYTLQKMTQHKLKVDDDNQTSKSK
jgi:hypothetical protein